MGHSHHGLNYATTVQGHSHNAPHPLRGSYLQLVPIDGYDLVHELVQGHDIGEVLGERSRFGWSYDTTQRHRPQTSRQKFNIRSDEPRPLRALNRHRVRQALARTRIAGGKGSRQPYLTLLRTHRRPHFNVAAGAAAAVEKLRLRDGTTVQVHMQLGEGGDIVEVSTHNVSTRKICNCIEAKLRHRIAATCCCGRCCKLDGLSMQSLRNTWLKHQHLVLLLSRTYFPNCAW